MGGCQSSSALGVGDVKYKKSNGCSKSAGSPATEDQEMAVLSQQPCDVLLINANSGDSNNTSQKNVPASDSGIESLSAHDESYTFNVNGSSIGCESSGIVNGCISSGFRDADENFESPMDCVCERNCSPQRMIPGFTCRCLSKPCMTSELRMSFKKRRIQRKSNYNWHSEEHFDLTNSLASGICHAGSEDFRVINPEAFGICAPLAKFESVDLGSTEHSIMTTKSNRASLIDRNITDSSQYVRLRKISDNSNGGSCPRINRTLSDYMSKTSRPQSLDVGGALSTVSLQAGPALTPTPGGDTDDSSPVYVFCGRKRISECEDESVPSRAAMTQEVVEMDVDGRHMVLIDTETYRQIMDEIAQLKRNLSTLTSIIQNGEESARNSLILQDILDASYASHS